MPAGARRHKQPIRLRVIMLTLHYTPFASRQGNQTGSDSDSALTNDTRSITSMIAMAIAAGDDRLCIQQHAVAAAAAAIR